MQPESIGAPIIGRLTWTSERAFHSSLTIRDLSVIVRNAQQNAHLQFTRKHCHVFDRREIEMRVRESLVRGWPPSGVAVSDEAIVVRSGLCPVDLCRALVVGLGLQDARERESASASLDREPPSVKPNLWRDSIRERSA